ncbi:NAD(P)-dependent alcohol dehydrogenase [Brevibacterium sp. 50QC2O2]|uniref:NAD(P)-dependent alcohol dehydrogenase n=1 Tax=Brevibacterium TaxID=1696 RepID=UPI00211C373C|nr:MULTISPECIES: NAD(P)-dependent alcohol dehydrogenase [unclassified Brevibacterium]MCQ9367239.1 NAD(P)-dependent alcohol dehydrogenase [Brevibacterium sp. 91QC2O2]MCQ9385625.1 NAD(P)-dependent alcohol dehydrogenase [Brevibacterium sp. 68QC2CO]MCQ9389865.1 NAD(P)-dependent alcohol dehydrogenase [Brevibacterium sp. 50QC2O2]
MKTVASMTAFAPDRPLEKSTVDRRDLRAHDVMIAIEYSGICHSDIHTVRDEWGGCRYPMTPGHEIVGRISEIGPAVTDFAVGDRVGVGCLVDSCGECEFCLAGQEENCSGGKAGTYNSVDLVDGSITQGGYSTHIPVKDDFLIRIPESLDPAAATPLLCAGITTYKPLARWGAGPGKRVAVVGLGGLGHVALKLAVAMGAEVWVVSHSHAKDDDALRFGAAGLIHTGDDPAALRAHPSEFDLIINTISAQFEPADYMRMLGPNGAMVLVGLPPEDLPVPAGSLTGGSKVLAGSNIGGIKETQEMIDFCAAHGVTAEIELINADQINEAYDRVVASDVRYRFVIDAATF